MKNDLDRTKLWLLVATWLLTAVVIVAGVAEHNINLSATALALVSYMGWLTKSIIGGKEDPP